MRFEDPTTEEVELAIAVAAGCVWATMQATLHPTQMAWVYRQDDGKAVYPLVEQIAKGLFNRNEEALETIKEQVGIASLWDNDDLAPMVASVMHAVEQLRMKERDRNAG